MSKADNPTSMVLAIYTASGVEVAALQGDRETAAASEDAALESLLGLVTRSIKEVKRTLADLSLIGVCTGPGSFTGLRIGVAFAISLAQARNVPIVGVSSYDVAAFGIQTYPLVCVARGKVGYYYARAMEHLDSEAQYVQGGREAIEQAARSFSRPAAIVGPDFNVRRPGKAALAVAKLARRALELGMERDWANIAIDYGQRPNAVIRFEQRRASAQGGPEVLAREPTTQ